MVNEQGSGNGRAGDVVEHTSGSDQRKKSFGPNPLRFFDIGRSSGPIAIDESPPSAAQQRAFSRTLVQKQALPAYALLFFTSIWGTLARLGLSAAEKYNGQTTFSLLWVQGLGCAIMGLCVRKRDELEELYPPLYVGLTIGFCGSFTSFSLFMEQVFEQFSDHGNYDRGSWHDFLSGLGVTLATIGLVVSAVQLGVHVADVLPRFCKPRPPTIDPIARATNADRGGQRGLELGGLARLYDDHEIPDSTKPANVPLDVCITCTGFGSWVGVVLLLGLHPAWRSTTFSVVLGPFGTVARLWIARWGNARMQKLRFPLGTFINNILSTAIFALAYLLQRTPLIQTNGIACEALQGIQDGFSGCLSTISTMIIEVLTLPRLNSYVYLIAVWTLSQISVLLIVGVYQFHVGLIPRCSY